MKQLLVKVLSLRRELEILVRDRLVRVFVSILVGIRTDCVVRLKRVKVVLIGHKNRLKT